MNTEEELEEEEEEEDEDEMKEGLEEGGVVREEWGVRHKSVGAEQRADPSEAGSEMPRCLSGRCRGRQGGGAKPASWRPSLGPCRSPSPSHRLSPPPLARLSQGLISSFFFLSLFLVSLFKRLVFILSFCLAQRKKRRRRRRQEKEEKTKKN